MLRPLRAPYSRFGTSGRWAAFGSVGMMWNLRNEKFMENSRRWLTNAQIAFSTGTSGNSSIPNYEHMALVSGGLNYYGDAGDRPGMRALRELSVRSPLRECGLTKAEIRRLSREAGLFTWDKPAYACLATRIRTGEEITLQKLKQTEKAEGFLFGLGFRDFRVRMVGNIAKLELRETDLPLLLENRGKIVTELRKDYDSVLLNLEVRK